MARIFAICSGSGGVGKSTIALTLALWAAKAGKQTVLLDASGTARACDLLLGIESIVSLDVVDVITGQARMEDALYRVPGWDALRFACASLYDDPPVSELASALLALHSLCDVLVLDMPTGQTELGAELLGAEDVRVVVTRADDMAMRAAERVMQRVARGAAQTALVVNRMPQSAPWRAAPYSVQTVEATLDCPAVGCIPEDAHLAACWRRGQTPLACRGPARAALADMARALLHTGDGQGE